ncbi:hypothetical protein [Aquimarina algiphila]|uniref:hypothetical protein n=1 Tax=Aquimarina algiphila TaxID=2047982 RepID=UPI00249358F6|nr:hypothetical protein [Aquimarina algiphila]
MEILEFNFEYKDKVIAAVKKLSTSKIFTQMNNFRDGDTPMFRLKVEGKENDVDFFIQQLNAELN